VLRWFWRSRDILSSLAHLHQDTSMIMEISMANQDKLNELATQLEAATTGIRGDVEELKRQVSEGTPAEELDFSALDARVAALSELDAENPAPATEGPFNV
jgi:hypothetical protein